MRAAQVTRNNRNTKRLKNSGAIIRLPKDYQLS